MPYKVVEGVGGGYYFVDVSADIFPGEEVVAPKPGEPALSWEDAHAIVLAHPTIHSIISQPQIEENQVSSWL